MRTPSTTTESAKEIAMGSTSIAVSAGDHGLDPGRALGCLDCRNSNPAGEWGRTFASDTIARKALDTSPFTISFLKYSSRRLSGSRSDPITVAPAAAAAERGSRIWAPETLTGSGFAIRPGKSRTLKGQMSARINSILASRSARRPLLTSMNRIVGSRHTRFHSISSLGFATTACRQWMNARRTR